jgi:hypothetical protein
MRGQTALNTIMAPTWSEMTGLLNSVLVWPVAAVVIVLIFRKDLTDLLGRLHSYEGMGQKLTFGNHIARAEEAAQRAGETVATPTKHERESKSGGLESQAEATELSGKWKPSAAMKRWASKRLPSVKVLAAWESLSAGMMVVTFDVDPTFKPKWKEGSGPALDRLVSLGVVSPSFSDAVNELRAARNQVAHDGYEPTLGAAETYSNTANNLYEDLKRAADAYVRRED